MSETDTHSEYTGDVTLTGDVQTPVRIGTEDTLENVYVMPNSVTGDLLIKNAEYVFTNIETTGDTSIDTPTVDIAGSLDDGYIKPGGVEGDLIIENAEDVCIAHNAVNGEIKSVGEEQQFHDTSDTTPPSHSTYDTVIDGWQQTRTITSPTTAVGVHGCENSITINDLQENIHVYVLGWKNKVRINGKRSNVTLHFTGSHNTVEVNPYIDLTIATNTGIENEITQDTYPVSDLIQTDKSEAYNNAFFGRKKVTYQEPATSEDICPNCGADADAVIERHQEDAFFIFSYPMYHFETTSASYECEECSIDAEPKVELNETERKDILQ